MAFYANQCSKDYVKISLVKASSKNPLRVSISHLHIQIECYTLRHISLNGTWHNFIWIFKSGFYRILLIDLFQYYVFLMGLISSLFIKSIWRTQSSIFI